MNKKEKTILITLRTIIIIFGLFGVVCLFALPPFGVIMLAVLAFCWYQTVRIKRGYIQKARAEAEKKARKDVEKAAKEAAEKEKIEREKARLEAEEKTRIEREQKEKEIEAHKEAIKNDPVEYKRLNELCKTIHSEYIEMLKEYRKCYIEIDRKRMTYLLKECWRKLSVISTNITYYDCYSDIDIFTELEKVEKLARSFINKYIKMEKERGLEDFEIDIDQFSEDLHFISDYIYDKEEKLNKWE